MSFNRWDNPNSNPWIKINPPQNQQCHIARPEHKFANTNGLKPAHDDLKPAHDDLKPAHDDLTPAHDDPKRASQTVCFFGVVCLFGAVRFLGLCVLRGAVWFLGLCFLGAARFPVCFLGAACFLEAVCFPV